MVSHTPIDVFMDMELRMFRDMVSAIRTVIEERNRRNRRKAGR